MEEIPKKNEKKGYSNNEYDKGYFSKSDFQLKELLGKIPYPNNIVIHKGYFPETVQDNRDLENKKFVFVNLDFDLYKPTYAGFEYFYPKLVSGGIILIHDYFSDIFGGASQAVKDYTNKYNLKYLAIGDGISVAFLKG